MKELKLTTWDRFHLLQTIPDSGTTNEIRKHLRLIALLEFTEEEKVLVGWQEMQIMTPQGPARRVIWGDKEHGAQVEADYEFTIEMEDADAAHLKKTTDQYTKWPTHKNTTLLANKLKKIAE